MPDVYWVFPAGVVLLLPFFFLASLSHDRLMRLFHDQYPEHWRAAGSPRGFFWKPQGDLPLASSAASMRAIMLWAFRPPQVLTENPLARRSLVLLRLGVVVWNIGIVALFAFVLLTRLTTFP